MGNGRTRTVNYTPRMSDLEAFDKLPPKLKHALQTSVGDWSAYATYRHWQKGGDIKATIAWIASGDATEVKRPWGRGTPSPTHALGLKPLKPNYAAA